MSDASTTSRTLQLLSLLQTHKYWVGSELARRLDVSPRTLRRDVERLRELGYRVNANRGSDGGYQLEAGADLPPLVFTDDEAVALAVSLRTAASSGSITGIADLNVAVLAKLEQVLPSRLRARIGALQSATVASVPTGSEGIVDPETLAILALACRNSERLRLAYVSAAGEETRRQVEPLKLVPFGRRWYLVCWDIDRQDWRTLRVDRISDVFETRVRFVPRPLPTADAAAFVVEQLGSLAQKHAADVLIHAEIADVEAYMGRYASGFSTTGPGRTLWRIESDQLEVMAGMLVWLPWEYEVDGPPQFVELLRSFGTRLRAATA